MAKEFDNLGELQLKIVRVLYGIKEGTVYDVLESLPNKDRPKYTTVLTVLRSLEKRGLLSHTMTEDRRYLYRPIISANRLEQGIIHSVLKKVFRGNVRDLVCTLLDAKKLSADELEEINRLIEEKQAGIREKGVKKNDS